MTLVRYCALLQRMGIVMAVVLGGALYPALARGADEGLPVVIAASVPLYPRTALLAHILGTVRIRVTTDGKNISSLDVESGPPMLVKAAEGNVRTWQFEEHKPTTFLVTFQYKIEEPAECSIGNSAVLLHMPSDIVITARGIHTCDPASTVQNNSGN